jgi:hypothetical protein
VVLLCVPYQLRDQFKYQKLLQAVLLNRHIHITITPMRQIHWDQESIIHHIISIEVVTIVTAAQGYLFPFPSSNRLSILGTIYTKLSYRSTRLPPECKGSVPPKTSPSQLTIFHHPLKNGEDRILLKSFSKMDSYLVAGRIEKCKDVVSSPPKYQTRARMGKNRSLRLFLIEIRR